MATQDYTVPFFLDGTEVTTSKTYPVVSPVNNTTVHYSSSATESSAVAAVDSASAAFGAWRTTTVARRRDIFLRAAEVMEKRRQELAGYLASETGSAGPWADFNVNTAASLLKDVAGRVATVEGSVANTQDETLSALVLREPYGVVVAMAPWNAPYILCMRAVAFPIAAGNTVVLKTSELSPRVMWAIASIFHEAGLPPGVLNTVSSTPADAAAVTSALISHPSVRKVNFTGSTAVGRILAKLAAEHLKPILLELGGKAPAIVWEDAGDLEAAADQCVLGAFLNAGQVCMSTERIIVHERIKDEFEAELARAVERVFPGDGDQPVLISAAAVEKSKSLVRDALGKGASIVAGGEDLDADADADAGRAHTLRPVVLRDVSPSMQIYATESFGPVVSLFTVSREADAIALANDTEYGLSSAVFTADLRRALRFARSIDAGAVHVDGMTVHDEPGLPHGGSKASGYGRFNATDGLSEWVKTKTVTFRN